MDAVTIRWAVLGISFIFTILVWFKLFRLKEHSGLKFLTGVVALIPVVGPLIGLWVIAMPNRQPRELQATMNHWGIGGRFIGYGSGKFTYGDMPDEGKDWSPTVPYLLEEIRQSKRKRKVNRESKIKKNDRATVGRKNSIRNRQDQ